MRCKIKGKLFFLLYFIFLLLFRFFERLKLLAEDIQMTAWIFTIWIILMIKFICLYIHFQNIPIGILKVFTLYKNINISFIVYMSQNDVFQKCFFGSDCLNNTFVSIKLKLLGSNGILHRQVNATCMFLHLSRSKQV